MYAVPMVDTEVVSFDQGVPQVRRSREAIALDYVKRVISSAAPEAIKFQRELVKDVTADPALRFKASEAILDRFIGKASQEIRIGAAEARPLVFNSKLEVLKAGMQAAIAASSAGESAMGAFTERVVEELSDREGVTI